MNIVTSRVEVKKLIDTTIEQYNKAGVDVLVSSLHKELLLKKVRFPLLEYAASELTKTVPVSKHVRLTDKITELGEIGGNVVVGIILQQLLLSDFHQAVHKAVAYIIWGDKWYVCDIIGERVLGYALLMMPSHAIPELEKLATHDDKWIVRSVGVATHYAVKKGLEKAYVEQMFELLLSLATTTDFHTKKGVGWGVKTIAKFHPEVIARHKEQIDTDADIKQWFKTKIKIGLGRTEKYAGKYTR